MLRKASLQELPGKKDLHGKKMHALSVPKPCQQQRHLSPQEGMSDCRVPLRTSPGMQTARVCELDAAPVCLQLGRPQMALCLHTTPAMTGSCPVPPWLTLTGGSRARGTRAESGGHSLLCEILIAGFWVATAAPGLLSLVSCMRSLMMACLSTEPAGTPGRLSGKSCGNWLFCRSSRISSKLSSSLPGCNKEHTDPSTGRCPPAVGQAGQPPVSRPQRPRMFWQQAWCGGSSQTCWRGTGKASQGWSALLLGSPEWHWHPSKAPHGNIWFHTLCTLRSMRTAGLTGEPGVLQTGVYVGITASSCNTVVFLVSLWLD